MVKLFQHQQIYKGVNMAKLFKSFKKIFSSSNFFDLGDDIVSYIQDIKDIETGICIINFEKISENLFEIKCDLIDRTSGEVYIRESFIKLDILSKDLPQHIVNSLLDSKENVSIKLQSEDIEKLADSVEVEKLKNCRWFNLLDYLRGNKVNKFELEDRAFYTLLNCVDDNNNVAFSRRIGIISEIPQKVFDAVYPFKSIQLNIEDY